MRIVGQIKNGIRRICLFRTAEDRRELVEIQNALLCRLASASEEAGKNIKKAVKEIDRILN